MEQLYYERGSIMRILLNGHMTHHRQGGSAPASFELEDACFNYKSETKSSYRLQRARIKAKQHVLALNLYTVGRVVLCIVLPHSKLLITMLRHASTVGVESPTPLS